MMMVYYHIAGSVSQQSVDVPADATVRDVARQVWHATPEIPLPQMVISHGGRSLNMGSPLSDAGVGAESVLFVSHAGKSDLQLVFEMLSVS